MAPDVFWSRVSMIAGCTLAVCAGLWLITRSRMPIYGLIGIVTAITWLNRRTLPGFRRILWATAGCGAIVLAVWWAYEHVRW